MSRPKAAAERKRARIGDVCEVKTPNGFAYFQYTHQHPMFGGLIRVLAGLYPARPQDISKIVRDQERFVTFIPVRAATNRGFVKIVANEPVPPHAQPFPLFKTSSGRASHDNWWLWDGEREWRIGVLRPEHRALPLREIWNLNMLVTRIVTGWSPEDEAVAPN